MGLRLASEEKELLNANFHWSTYIGSGIWAFLGCISLLGIVFSPENPEGSSKTQPIALNIVIFFLPLTIKFLKNKCKTYAVTNKRLYTEEGIISKSKQDVPFHKINDIQMKQGVFQRMFGSGNILVLTGNSLPIILKDIENPNEFKDHLFNIAQPTKNVA